MMMAKPVPVSVRLNFFRLVRKRSESLRASRGAMPAKTPGAFCAGKIRLFPVKFWRPKLEHHGRKCIDAPSLFL
jgi:hypothetical protein